jgi:uncharacterized protein (TIGR02147 family)
MDRPVIFDYRAIPDYLNAMVKWNRQADPTFSVRRATKPLRRCSPALVTRVLQGQRRLTPDRVEAFARLLRLDAQEKCYLNHWITLQEGPVTNTEIRTAEPRPLIKKRKEGQNDLLKDWLNVYVMESCRLKGFRPIPALVHQILHAMASPKRVEQSLKFLLREGFLRRTLEGRVVTNDEVVTTTDATPNEKIRNFHRRALDLARKALDLYPMSQRRQYALILPLNESSIPEVKELLKEFYEKLLLFSEQHLDDNETLYQVTINLCPVGGQKSCES